MRIRVLFHHLLSKTDHVWFATRKVAPVARWWKCCCQWLSSLQQRYAWSEEVIQRRHCKVNFKIVYLVAKWLQSSHSIGELQAAKPAWASKHPAHVVILQQNSCCYTRCLKMSFAWASAKLQLQQWPQCRYAATLLRCFAKADAALI